MSPEMLYSASTWVLPVIIAITLHEAAHGFAAYLLGDSTAWRLGRVSLNPLKHIDPFGTLLLPAMLLFLRAPFLFGYAKPVPVNFSALNHPRRDMVLVALAGPGMNLILALLGAAILAATVYFSGGAEDGAARLVAANALNFVLINIFLGVFNLLPVPPFDGGHVVQGLLPQPAAAAFARVGRYSLLVMVSLLLVLPQFGVDIVGRLISPIADAILRFFLGIFGLSL